MAEILRLHPREAPVLTLIGDVVGIAAAGGCGGGGGRRHDDRRRIPSLPRKVRSAIFLAAGYDKRQALEVLVGVTMKTLSNYANHLTDTPLNEQFAAEAWKAKAA
jgi:hypothetical protein